jgi:hypothetical protein
MKKNFFFCILKVTEDFCTDPHPHPDTLVRGTDPRIRIRILINMCHGSVTLQGHLVT